MKKYDSDYICPFCGESSTFVENTMPLKGIILRKRKCNTCGRKHITKEYPSKIDENIPYIYENSDCKNKKHERRSSYVCPFCRKPATSILKTISLERVVVRKRACSHCGRIHPTEERFMAKYAG